MTKPYSEDLKWRIVYLHVKGYSQPKISHVLCVSIGLVNKVLQFYKKWGCVENPFYGQRGRRKTLKYNELKVLSQLVRDKPDWYLDELVQEMKKITGKSISVPAMWRPLKYCGISHKKLTKAAKERDEIVRAAFIARIGKYRPDQLIFLDEAAKDERTLTRSYGYAFTNARAQKKVVFVRGKRYTILPALSLDGILALDVIEGSCTKALFQEFILSQLLLEMRPYPEKNSVIVLDNARIHHNPEWIEIVESMGCRVEFLPPYSPDFNPIELAFNQIKIWLKRHCDFVAAFDDDPMYPLRIAFAYITSETATSFFKHCHYL